jgi:type IV pilus assembly protein PilQ
MKAKKGSKDKIMDFGLLRSFLRNSLAMTTAVIASERSERSNLKPIIFTLFLSIALILNTSVIAQEPIVEDVSSPGNVTLVFKDADIRTVLHTLSYKSGVNIVASSDVEGTVSIRLVDVPWETALEVILKNHGLAVERVGNIMRVITLTSVAEEELQNEVFVLNYAKAAEIADSIEATVTERGRIKFDARTNTLIVTDIPTNLYKVRSVVSRLDRRTPQVAIEARIIEARLGKEDELGIDWNVEVAASGSARPTTFPFERDSLPFSRRGKKDQSMQSYFPSGGPIGTADEEFLTPLSFPNIGAEAFTFGTLDFTQLTATLRMLDKKTDTSIISNPNITTLNNKEAKIIVGQIFNIPTYERNDTTGRMEITGYTEKDVGIILTVVPHINEVNDIVVDLKPEVTTFLDWDEFGAGANAIFAPRFTTRTAETQVMVRDGQTIVIGGLRENQTIKVNKKVPFFGDIPLVGELFKYKEDAIDTKDLIIFITVRLVPDDRDDKPIMDKTVQDFFNVKSPEDVRYR